MPEHPTHVPHGPEDCGLRWLSFPLPLVQCWILLTLFLENVNSLYCFAHHLRLELDGAHYLADGCHSLMISQFHELSVKFNSLKDEHDHLYNSPLYLYNSVALISQLSPLPCCIADQGI